MRWGVPAVAIVLVAASFGMGVWFARPKWQQAQDAATPIVVWATVEQRVVDDRAELSGSVATTTTSDVVVPVPDQAVVTVAPPARIEQGGLILEASGTPYFLLPGPLALYRDLRVGDHGADVQTLEDSLVRLGYDLTADGVVSTVTVEAVQEVFRDAGYELPTETVSAGSDPSASPSPKPQRRAVIPVSQLVTGPAGEVATRVKVGERISPDTPVVRIRSTTRSVTATVGVDERASFPVGQQVAVMSDGKKIQGKVARIGAYESGTDGRVPGYPATIDLSAADAKGLSDGQSVLVTLPGGAVSAGPAIPVTAIRHDDAGDFVLAKGTGTQTPARTSVKVLRTANGWAAVEGVSEGTEVQVS
ncbi:hypothetical protein [Propionicicella superfundia]|uniref:hypothetical protein n=1 Tax=Propionicicella superfundia TaxID=348582 RepID=UPI000401A55B|nr:hypothetical protein [Propionicicella superfundia]